MTGNAIVVLALFLLSLAGALISGRSLLYSLTYFWGGVLAISFLWSRLSLRGIAFNRNPRSLRSQVGHLIIERFVLVNTSRIPKVWLEVVDASTLPGIWASSLLLGSRIRAPSEMPGHRASSVLLGLRPKQSRIWLARTLCTRRGSYRLGPARLQSGDPFGLFPTSHPIRISHPIVVLPMIVPVTGFPAPSGRLPGGAALRHATHQITTNASSVRGYAPGDSLSRIHWRSTARQRRLMVKEFELDPKAEMWIVLDAWLEIQQSLPESPADERRGWSAFQRSVQITLPPSSEEYAVSAAASIVTCLMERDRAVGLVAYGRRRQVIQADRGASQLHRILESLAVLQARGEVGLDEVLKVEGQRIPRGATAILITVDIGSRVISSLSYLIRTGRAPVLVLLDAQTFGGAPGSDSLAGAARRLGVPVSLVRCGEPLGEALSFSGLRSFPAVA